MRVVSLSLRLRLITPTSSFISLDITKPHPIIVYDRLASNKSNEMIVLPVKSVAFLVSLQALSVEYFILTSDVFVACGVALPIFPLCCDRKLANHSVCSHFSKVLNQAT